MNSTIKNLIKKVFPTYSLYFRAVDALIKNKKSYLYTSGWMRSLQGSKPVDQDGSAVPWMNYPVIKFLQERLKKDCRLFEFGSGYSTLFYAGLVQSVTSLEHDQTWFQRIRKDLPKNVELLYRKMDQDAEYCRAILASGQKYDVVVVDGKDRPNCLRQSIAALSERGVILLDDANRKEYLESIETLKKSGFRALSFEGLKPNSKTLERTTIFYRNNNCLDI